MPGETDLDVMLRMLSLQRRDEVVTVVSVDGGERVDLGCGVLALITEAEGTTAIVEVSVAEERGWPVDFRAVWFTVEVHSALEAVGLTAALSDALAAANVPCNVVAGYYHDHLLIPVEQADVAEAALLALRDR